MAEYIEREVLLEVLRGSAVLKYPTSFVLGLYAAADEVSKIPAADVVEVVRCKDCKHTREKNEYEKAYLVEEVLICTSSDVADDCWCAVWPDHFCSYGERRKEDG